jgi:hypothetical protein
MGKVMIRIGWWLADAASQLLEPHERDAVRGDLAECGAGGWRALYEVLGLVARRQVSCWMEWRPWLAVFAIVLPIGVMLSHASRWWADDAVYTTTLQYTLYEWSGFEHPEWRDVFLPVWSALTGGVSLACWSWTSGYVLASLSRRAVWVSIALFALVVFLGTLGTTTIVRTHSGAFAEHFFAVVFPRLIRVVLVLLPALWGMHSYRRASVSRLTLSIGAVVLMVLTLLTAPFLEGSMTLGRGAFPSPLEIGPDKLGATADDLRPLWPISLVMLWPTAAILVSTLWRRASLSS